MKLTKEYNDYLIKIAMALPLLKEGSCEKHRVMGSEILEWETITEIDGEAIDPEKSYLYSFPLVVYVDHFKRLQKAWKRKGPNGVSEYMLWIDGIVGRQKKESVPAPKKKDFMERVGDSITKFFNKNNEATQNTFPPHLP